jgi:cation diffusion facilitator CzcD-associated flavoprotein CzcO
MDRARRFHVGLVGAGIGGLAAAIAIAQAGAQVTVLEAAVELGEVRLTCLRFSINMELTKHSGTYRLVQEYK